MTKHFWLIWYPNVISIFREHLKGKYHCSVDYLFDQFSYVPLCSIKFRSPSIKYISKPPKQEVNRTVILPHLVVPGFALRVTYRIPTLLLYIFTGLKSAVSWKRLFIPENCATPSHSNTQSISGHWPPRLRVHPESEILGHGVQRIVADVPTSRALCRPGVRERVQAGGRQCSAGFVRAACDRASILWTIYKLVFTKILLFLQVLVKLVILWLFFTRKFYKDLVQV